MTIKQYNRVFEHELNFTIGDHWRIRNEKLDLPYPNTKRIIPIGDGDDRFRQQLIEAIKSAKKTIMLCSFILSDDQIINEIIAAAERRVRCYLMFSTETQLSKEYKEKLSDFDEKTLNEHKKMLESIKGKVLARSSDHLHAKFLIIDYGLNSQQGFLSTANFTKEALTRNQELGVVLTREETKELFDFFRFGFWHECKNELEHRGKFWNTVKKIPNINHLNYQKLRVTSPISKTIRKEILSILSKTNNSIFIGCYGFEENHKIVELVEKSNNTYKTNIITRPRDKNITTIKKLADKGAVIVGYEYLHAKFIIDTMGKSGLIMTANIETKGMDEGYEVALVLSSEDIQELAKITNYWFKKAPLIWEKGGNIQKISLGKIKVHNNGPLIEKEIINEKVTAPIIKNPKDLREMRKIIEEGINISQQEFNGKIPKKIITKLTINPPRLPDKAILIDKNNFETERPKTNKLDRKTIIESPVPIYKLNNNYYGVIKTWEDYDKLMNKLSKIPKTIRLVTK